MDTERRKPNYTSKRNRHKILFEHRYYEADTGSNNFTLYSSARTSTHNYGSAGTPGINDQISVLLRRKGFISLKIILLIGLCKLCYVPSVIWKKVYKIETL